MSVKRDTSMHISSWILEFLLRQKSVDDHLLNSITRALPLPDDNPSLKRRLILRNIESDAQKGIISEDTLDFLEQIEELEYREGNIEVSKAMKMAYCAVAVHCTVKFLEESVDDKEKKYCNAVGRIWRGKIRKMERVVLVSADLISWLDDIEAGICDVGVREKLLVRYKGLNVFEVLQGYLHEAKEKMGPSFLELVANTLSDEALRDIMRLRDVNASGSSRINEIIVLPRREFKDMGRPIKVRCVTHRSLKIANTEETSPGKYDNISTPEVIKVQEAPATNTLELPQMVKDPLPNALKATIARENMAHDHDKNSEALQANRDGRGLCNDQNTRPEISPMVKRVLPNSLKATVACESNHNKNSEALQVDKDGRGLCKDHNKRPKVSPVEPNNTAHTVELSDSIGNFGDGSQTRHDLHSSEKREPSPLKMSDYKKLPRKKKRWTNVEEDTLRAGVQEHGKGNWKLILTMYRDKFEDRTEVDLKDKWRNLTRP